MFRDLQGVATILRSIELHLEIGTELITSTGHTNGKETQFAEQASNDVHNKYNKKSIIPSHKLMDATLNISIHPSNH